ncbi:hypothetical protein [Paenibacillus sp. FSL H8-0034]|uniref:hypothetical protein n=1 Tax=Paenibacillus sp. FSL H8-0034 TaxID=2954671 RepID=UPI0030F84668
MSSCLILQTLRTILIGSDTAISTNLNDQIYRLSDDGEKLWSIDGSVIFCSGDMDTAYKIMGTYLQLQDRKVKDISRIARILCKDIINKKIAIVVCSVLSNCSIVYDISSETNFEIIEKRMGINQSNDVAIWAAGIKTKEAGELAEKFLGLGYDALTTYKKVFNEISYEGVGGSLVLKQVTQEQVKNLMIETITEKPDMKILTEELYWKLQPQLIIAERVFGKLIAGVNLQIDASDETGMKTFTVDGNGVTIAGTRLTITGGLPTSQLDPTFKDSLVNLGKAYNGVVIDSVNGLVITKSDNAIRTVLNATDGFKFQKNVSGTWTDRLSYDAITGNLVIDGSINARELKINGTNVLVGASTIGGQFIDKIKVEQLDATTAKIGSAMIGSIFANQIVVGNGTIADNLLSGSSRWNGRTTLINDSGIYTGTLTANQINVIQGITLGANATIDWSYMNKPTAAQVGALPSNTFIPTVPAYITATKITQTSIESPNITGGTIVGTIFKTASNGARLQMDTSGIKSYNSSDQYHGINISSGNFSYLDFYYQGEDRGGMYQAGGVLHIEPRSGADLVISPNYAYGNITIQAGSSALTKAKGNWDFTEANVTGIYARFA